MLSNVIRLLLGLVGIILFLNGGLWAFAPASNLDANSITVASSLGMNMIKSDIGAPLITAGLFLLAYSMRQGLWFFPSVMISTLYALVRATSVLVDGPSRMALVGVGLEIFVVVLLVIDRRLTQRTRESLASRDGSPSAGHLRR